MRLVQTNYIGDEGQKIDLDIDDDSVVIWDDAGRSVNLSRSEFDQIRRRVADFDSINKSAA